MLIMIHHKPAFGMTCIIITCVSCSFFKKRCIQKKYPADLPSLSVVLIYLNEALSIIKRAIRSIIDKTPASLLREIILVDDHSTIGTGTKRGLSKCLFLAYHFDILHLQFIETHSNQPIC